jgi:hypothetical protein
MTYISSFPSAYDYDVALSFAGEDRVFVEKLARALKSEKVKVFYDKDEADNLWGKDLYAHLSDVYQRRARFTIIFVSRHYAAKRWPRHELQSAQARAFQEASSEYILPVRFDDTEIPGLPKTIGYVDAQSMAPERIAALFVRKLDTERRKIGARKSADASSHLVEDLRLPIDIVIENSTYQGFDFRKAPVKTLDAVFLASFDPPSDPLMGNLEYRIATATEHSVTIGLRSFFPERPPTIAQLPARPFLKVRIALDISEYETLDGTSFRHIYTYTGYLPLTIVNSLGVLSARDEDELSLKGCRFYDLFDINISSTNIEIIVGMYLGSLIEDLPHRYYMAVTAQAMG